MILSANTLPVTVLQTDIAIIGAGASGLALASGLKRDAVVIDGGSLAPNPDRDEHITFETSGLPMNTHSLRRGRLMVRAVCPFRPRRHDCKTMGKPCGLADVAHRT